MPRPRVTPDDPQQLWHAWSHVAVNPDIETQLLHIYQQTSDAINQRQPICWQSGKCCRFDSFGHRLYVTGLEIAWFLRQIKNTTPATPNQPSNHQHTISLPLHSSGPLPDACPYQLDGLCSTHAIRPLGCRVFFCQEGTEDWQNQLYEDMLAKLRKLHDDNVIAYRYMEWRQGLREAQIILPADG